MLLEIDAGESPDEPEELWRLADVLAIACGGHAGDLASMRRVLDVCTAHGIAAGAHPSYPDREGFGRRTIAIAPTDLERSIAEQCASLAAFGVAIQYVKPHGALYHDASRDRVLADAVVRGVLAGLAPGSSVAVIGPPTSELATAARSARLRYLREGFADRGTRPDGSLIPRGEPGALTADPVVAAARARALAGHVDSVCVHADTPNALAIARAVRDAVR